MIFASRSRAGFRPRAHLAIIVAALALAPALGARTRAHPTRHPAETREAPFKGAIVVDAATGRVLIDEHADEVSPPASMTKLMTFAVLSDKLASGQISLDTPVHVDRSDARMGGTQVYLDPRETFSVEELIYAMLIQSANDAAHALARVAGGGSIEAFVADMNAKARELGMTHSTFRSPHGLPPADRRLSDSDLTSPRDYAILCRYLLLHTDILKYTSVRERKFGLNRPQGPILMVNHNKLLGRIAGVDGLKTGYTDRAGYCLSATAERNGHRVIVVIMGALGPGGRRDFGHARDLKVISLLDRGFTEIPATEVSFDSERTKFVKPAVIPLSGATQAALPAAGPAAPSTDSGPVIKLSLPGMN